MALEPEIAYLGQYAKLPAPINDPNIDGGGEVEPGGTAFDDFADFIQRRLVGCGTIRH